jgi:hypothetical protein
MSNHPWSVLWIAVYLARAPVQYHHSIHVHCFFSHLYTVATFCPARSPYNDSSNAYYLNSIPSSHSINGITPSIPGGDRSPGDIAFYDATASEPISSMITHFRKAFFTRLGCNYPFLRRERFLRDLEDKRVGAILVDAVSVVVARFSSHPFLALPSGHGLPLDSKNKVQRASRGRPFA